MKAVLMSIRPQSCELIASGKKSVEVRKTKPKLDTPIKVYIYCTNSKEQHLRLNTWFGHILIDDDSTNVPPNGYNANGKVIGEFVFDKVFLWNRDIHDEDTITLEDACQLSCLSENALLKYADGYFYGWHISDLMIYDKPKPLTDFAVQECLWHNIRNNGCIDAGEERCYDCQLKRPPQSWCYVEGL